MFFKVSIMTLLNEKLLPFSIKQNPGDWNIYCLSTEDFSEQEPLKIMITSLLLTGPSHTGFFIQKYRKFSLLSSSTILLFSSTFAEFLL